MNKIFKKVWNRRRGCFVAVSEAMSSVCQGKTKAVLAASLLLVAQVPAFALVTINGDVVGKDPQFQFQGRGPALADSHTINGNLTWNLGREGDFRRSFLCVSIGAGYFSSLSNTLIVNGNFNINNNSWVHIAHNGDEGGNIYSALNISKDLNISSDSELSLISNGGSGNDPTIHASLNVGGTVYNSGRLISYGGTQAGRTYGSFSINNLVNNGTFVFDSPNALNGTFNNITQAGGYFQQGGTNDFHINGTLTVSGGTVGNNDAIVVGADQGKFSVGQGLNLAGGAVGNLSVLTHVGGSVMVSAGSYGIGTLNKSNGTLTNKSTLTVSNFNQSNGTTTNSGNLTIGNANLGGTLNSTGTLNLTGNVVTRGNLTSTGNLNNRGNWTETNRYTIAANLNNSGSVNFQNGFEFSNGRLTSSGTVQTNNVFDVFDSIGETGQQDLNYVGLGSSVPQEVKTSLTDFFLKYLPGKLAQNLISHASFTGGKVVVTGVELTQTQADDLKKAFKDKFGGNTALEFQGTISGVSHDDKLTVAKTNELYDNVEHLRDVIFVDKDKFGGNTALEFQGTISGVSHDDKLTVAKTNELYDNVEHLRDVIFVDRKLEGENGAIVVGDSGLRNNTGFTGINEATGTTIQDGKELTLIGGKSDGTGDRFTLAERIISAVGDGAKLILGSLGIKDSSVYQGQAEQVHLSDKGELKVAAGDYLVKNLNSSGGKTTVDKNAVFNSENATFTDKAFLENNGETVLGTLTGWNGAEVHNNSKLTVNGITQFGGRFINNANAKLVGTADLDGTLQNSQGASLIANTVNVNGTLRNFGYMEALDNSTVFGTLENPGEIRLFNTAIGSRGEGDFGTIGNTYTLKATGKTQVSGLIANAQGAVAEFSGDDAELLILDGGVVSNNGTLIADSLIVNDGGYFINGDNARQTFTASPLRLRAVERAVARATEQLKNLTVSEGGTKTNNGLAYYGTGTIAGEFINASGAEAFGGVSDIFVDGSGLGITNTGSIKNAGTFTFGGTLNNSGSITGDGLIVFKRAGLGNDTFTNAGQINVGSLEAANVKYVQTAGSLSSASGWFSNSTVDLTGGTIEHTVLGSGNTYNLGAGSGSNDAATFTVGTLDSSSVVNINRGATLRTEHIAMDGHKTTNLQGGRLSTTLDQVFADLDYSTLNLDAVNPDDKVEVTSNPQIVTGVGNVIDSVAEGVAFQWGTVAFDDASYSAALAGDAVNKLVSNPQIVTGVGNVIDSVAEGVAFQWGTVAFDDASYSAALAGDAVNKLVAIGDVPAERRGELEVAFNGKAFQWGTVAFDDASYSAALAGDAVNKLVAIGDVPAERRGELEVAFNGKAAERFNVDLANSIKATAAGTLAYATFANETLSNETTDNPGATSLVVGVNEKGAIVVPSSGTPNVLSQNMGFMNVTGVTDGLYINNGSHFVLVGQSQPNPNLAPVELADGTVWVGGNRNDNGTVTPSKLTLGSYGSASATKGHLAQLNIGISPVNNQLGGAGGQVIVKNGVFTIDTLNNGSAGYGEDREGLVIGNADDTTTQLIVTNYAAVDGSAMSNHGLFKAENIASRNTNNSFVNHGTFEIGTADISGYLDNKGTASFDDLTLREYGTVNRQDAELTAGKLTVAGNALAGASGTYAIRGELDNQGKLSVTDELTVANRQDAELTAGKLTVAGNALAGASGTYAIRGELDNQGKLSVTDELTVAGDVSNSGELNAEKSVVQAAASDVEGAEAGNFINNALVKFDSLLTEAGSIVSNAADAVLTIAGLNNASELQGTVNNDGTIKVEGTQSVTVADGELNNNGSMENTNALNVEGGLVNNKGNLALTGLNITGGQVSNDASAYFKDAGVTEIAMSDTGDVAIQNGGLLDLTDLQLTKGTISGGTVGVKETTIASVKADGVIDAASVGFKDLTNEGVITVSDVFASANTENSGTVDAANIAMSDGDKFVNKAGATATSDKLDLAGGEFVNEAGDTSGIALTQIGENGQFTANGDTTLQQVGSAGGTINLNKGNLNIAELDAKDSVYNQTAGNFKADKGFFENSTLNIMGGVFDASEVRDAEGNVTGLLGNNVVNISGPNKTPVINNEDSVEDKAHYKDNLTQVLAGVVNSDTTVNIMEGGVLDVAEIKLDGSKADSINLKGGVLQTSADQIFGSVTTEAIRIDAADPETGTVQLPTTVLTATTVGAVKDEIKTGLNVESGNLALDDDWFSSSLIVSVTDKIANAFENAADLTINFLGKMSAPFTVTTANDLETEGLDVVKNPGIVLNTTTLHNEFADEYNKENDANQTVRGLVIGAASNDENTNSINISMGFKDITHADKVTIEGGKELVLVGNAVNAIPEASFGDDANKLLKDAADGGSIDVNDGKFTFGSHGGSTPTVGWILSSNIGENGSLEAKNGEFADWTIANKGNVHVHSNAILHTNSLTGNGAAVNEGKLSLDEKDGTGPTFDVAGSFTNKGENSVLDASKVEKVTVSGTHVNEGKADYKDMLVAEGGSSTNSGTEQGNILTVEGSHANTGTSIWNGVTVADKGKGENAGKLDVGSVFDVLGEFLNKGAEAVLDATKTAVTNVAGSLRNEGTANYDDMTIAGSVFDVLGEFLNKGAEAVLDATKTAVTNVAGSLRNEGTANYDDMTIAAGGKSDNSGYEKGDILTIADGGEHTNSGTSIWNNQTVKEGGTSVTEEGGKETINDKYVIEGDKTNRGEVDAKGVENTEVKGNLDGRRYVRYRRRR